MDPEGTKIKIALDENKLQLIAERNVHNDMAQLAYEQKANDKLIAKFDKTKSVFTFDLQQCLPTPYLTTSVSSNKRQQWSFNLTVHDLVSDKATCFLWDETISGRGANEIASCLYKYLLKLPSEISEVTFYSDTCGGQNKNNIVALMFLHFVNLKPDLKINHKFLISGHSHMECDTDHSIIERAKKRYSLKINHLNDWVQLIRVAKRKNPFHVGTMTKEDFFDFRSLGKNDGPFVIKKNYNRGEHFLWEPAQWLQYEGKSGQLLFKHSLKEEECFKKKSFCRRGRRNTVVLKNINFKQLPIAKEKKKRSDVIITANRPSVSRFLQNLKTKNEIPCDPVLVELDPDNEPM